MPLTDCLSRFHILGYACLDMRFRSFLTLAFVFSLHLSVYATHLRAADILVEQDCNTLRYKITVRVYMNTLSRTPFGGRTYADGHLNFGDGTPLEMIVPEKVIGPTTRPDLGPEIAVASYTTFHTFARAGSYKITYFERDRSSGILNIANSLDVAYSTFVVINAQTAHCNKLPILQVAPVDRGCKGVVFYHSAGATDSDGDSLSYELTIPSKDSTRFVDNFIQPDAAIFYSDFAHGNEAGTGPPSFSIDPVTGLITWDAPGMQGEYNIAFKIIEWRFDAATGKYFMISTTIRDMQIVVEDCFNGRPILNGPSDICIQAGETLTGTFVGSDPENHAVRMEVFSPIFDGGPETFPATYDPPTFEFRPSDPPAELRIEWKTDCIHVRDQVYQVVIKITDNPPLGPKLVTYRTWNIKVIAPPPLWKNNEPDLVERTAKLEWQDYSCMNAEKIQLWRKVGSFPFVPGRCVAGLSVDKGYTLLKEFDPSVTSFTDSNDGKKLSVGAQYCYRLVAVFPLPAGGKSYVSSEACVGPILADAPVITNVTIMKTASAKGKVEVRWTKPFDISSEQYPEPYQYEVYRDHGFTQEGGGVVNVSGRIGDVTTFVDSAVNTMDSVYNYQVVLYSRTQNNPDYSAIDTSSVASTVRLLLEPGNSRMTLRWNADVPWSNVTLQRPYHRIYRGIFGDEKDKYRLIDSVDVSEMGFEYTDMGSGNEPIQDDKFYSYYIETIGSYGNPMIPLLFNHSQIASAYPVNVLPLCVPVLEVARTNCETFLAQTDCEENYFENFISWAPPQGGGCRKDIRTYRLYYSDLKEGEYVLLGSFDEIAQFKDEVPMLSRCYKISAVDAQGNESSLSEPLCNENCPYFELPNVFTPNDDGCNDLFTSYAEPDELSPCVTTDQRQCPRFVKSISMKVMNRWGRVVYDFRSEGNASSRVGWNGRDLNGTLLDAGVYYYTADVEFYSVDPSNGKRKMKGWINLVR
jgi:hypothetical protein